MHCTFAFWCAARTTFWRARIPFCRAADARIFAVPAPAARARTFALYAYAQHNASNAHCAIVARFCGNGVLAAFKRDALTYARGTRRLLHALSFGGTCAHTHALPATTTAFAHHVVPSPALPALHAFLLVLFPLPFALLHFLGQDRDRGLGWMGFFLRWRIDRQGQGLDGFYPAICPLPLSCAIPACPHQLPTYHHLCLTTLIPPVLRALPPLPFLLLHSTGCFFPTTMYSPLYSTIPYSLSPYFVTYFPLPACLTISLPLPTFDPAPTTTPFPPPSSVP